MNTMDHHSEKDLAYDVGQTPDDLDYKGQHPIPPQYDTKNHQYVVEVDHATLVVGDVPPEVRAVVPQADDPIEPCETFRAYFLGIVVTVVGTGINTWFGSRQPGVYISPFIAQFLSHPAGVLLSKVLPTKQWTTFGRRWSLNPGPWTIKEHVIVTLMATVSFPTATAMDIILAIKLPVFFNNPTLGGNIGFQTLIILSTQFLGFGIAGLGREYLVYPSSMLWPLNLAKVSLFNALHRRKVDEAGIVHVEEDGAKDPPVHGWTITMFRFCLYCIIASFCWFFFTEFIAPFLLYFNWPTWIAPNNAKLAIIMGSVTGLGLNPLPTFDWTYISGAGLTPLITPWWATLSQLIGCFIGFIVIVAMYFSNTWYTAHLLPNSNSAFDRFGLSYNVSRILLPDQTLDVAAYEAYSPLYYSAGYNFLFGAFFAGYTATILHALLNHWPQLSTGFRLGIRNAKAMYSKHNAIKEIEERPDLDIHYNLIRRYKEVPQWWFVVVALIALVLGIVNAEAYNTTMPVWGIFLAFFLALLLFIPAGIIMAISNVQVTLVVLAEIIPGVAIPGRPYANMIFKIYGWIALVQALLYVQDQKLAHYLHLPPRATFRAQMIGCLIGSFVSLGVINWQMTAVSDLCVPGQKDLLTCPYYTTFYSSALLFGVIGPERVYGSNGLYKNLMWSFFVGAALVVVAWLIKRKWPNNFTKSVNIPVIIGGALYWAPYNISFVWSGVPLAWFFMSFVYKRYPAWWNKYTYILSIGLTVGAAIAAVIIFFCITYPGGSMPVYWGNTVMFAGCDGLGCVLEPIPEKGWFGPAPGEF